MRVLVSIIVILLWTCICINNCFTQCKPTGEVQSERLTNYIIKIKLDHDKKIASGTSKISWTNNSPKTVSELRMYMYLNAFKNMKSTWLRPTSGRVFDQSIHDRPKAEWGFVNIDKISARTIDLTTQIKYIQPDGNVDDESLLSVPLGFEVMPGETLELDMVFTSKLPKTIARSGYGENNFHLFVHWYPKLGVYEQDNDGEWDWNCHQFMQSTEFYGEFGNYDVEITCDQSLVLGSSGCEIDERINEDGTKTIRYLAEDVIDYGWVVSPEFDVYEDTWQDTYIKLLVPTDHCGMADRYMTALKQSLDYFDKHLGRYPYPSITVVDPPFHSLRNGFMEYPTMITVGAVRNMPGFFRGSESLLVHEFSHQFFMAVLASNEKEEAWLDEGFVTYYEDRIMEEYYGKHTSQFDLFGIKYGNSEMSRQEYVRLHKNMDTSLDRPGWEIDGDFKGIVYSKTATMLKTLENYIGIDKMDELMKSYFNAFKFKHPRKEDFLNISKQYLRSNFNSNQSEIYIQFLIDCIESSKSIDYMAALKNEKELVVTRVGDLFLPVDVRIKLENGEDLIKQIKNNKKEHRWNFESAIQSVVIDPDRKIYIDQSFINNGVSLNKPNYSRYSTKAVNWINQVLHALGTLI